MTSSKLTRLLRRGLSKITSLPLVAVCAAGLLGACGPLTLEQDYPEINQGTSDDGGSLLSLFQSDDGAEEAPSVAAATPGTAAGGLGVNALLWQASLDTLSFMPLASADPMGGVIITDWYNDPGTAGERVKVNLVISGRELRADALRVTIFREKRVKGRDVTLAASSRAARQMENIILTRARDLAIAAR